MSEIKNIPNGWAKAKIKDLFDFIGGGTPSKQEFRFWNGEIPWASVKDIKGNHLIETQDTITQIGLENSASNIAEPGEVILVTRISPGKVIRTKIRTAINQDLKIIRPKYEANPNFIKYLFNILEKKIVDLSSGTTVLGIRLDILNDIEIIIPPLKEQNRIVEKLDELLSELERGREQLQTSLEQLKIYRQSILKHAFEGNLSKEWRNKQKKLKTPDELVTEIKAYRKQQYEKQLKEYEAGKTKVKPQEPKDFNPVSKKNSDTFKAIPSTWFWTQINEISDNITYGYTEKSSKEKIGPKFLRITDIQDNSVNWNTVPYCKISKEKIEQYLLSKGDLVFARTGATVGKSFLIRSEPPEAVYASYLIRIRIYKIFIPEFMAYFFQSEFYWKQITEGQVGIGQPNVNGSKLSELFIPLMSQTEQKEIVELLDASMTNCDQLERKIIENSNSIEVVKQSLLQKAFEGKLVEQDPNDDSASSLLQKIVKEREENIKLRKSAIYDKIEISDDLTVKKHKISMAEQLRNILEILKENKKPVASKILWQSSNHKDDINGFYTELKELIEEGKVVESKRKGKETYIQLTK